MAGSGTFVDVNEGHVLLNDMATEIQAQIDYVTNFADTQIVSLNSAITDLSAAVGEHTVTVEAIDKSWTGVTGAVFPEAPTFAALVLDDYPSSDITEPTILDFTGIDFTYVAPIAPTAVDSTFSFTQGAYTSDMWVDLFAAVHDKVLGGDYGISATAHTAMVAREQTAREANQDKEYQALVDGLGATGFNLASGHTAYALTEFAEEIVRRDQDALNNITVNDFTIGNDNEKFYITSGTELEKITIGTFEKAEEISIEAAKATQEYIYKFVSENIKLYLGAWEGVKQKLISAQTQVSAIVSANTSETDVYQARASVLKTRYEGISSKNLGLLGERKTETEVYTTEVGAVASEYGALINELKVWEDNLKLQVDSAIAEAGLNLTAYTESAKLGVSVASGIAGIASQGVASALGAINTSLSNSYSGTENRAERWGHTSGITETHSTQHDAD